MNSPRENSLPPTVVSRKHAFVRLLLFAVFALAMVFLVALTPLRSYFSADSIRMLAARLGPWGPAALFVLGVVSPLVFLPRWPIAFAGGLLYGLLWGGIIANLASTLGAGLHFMLAGALLAPSAKRLQCRFDLPEGADMPPARVFAIIFVLRAFPFSNFVATNLLAGAWKVRADIYLGASFLGMIPSTLMYAACGRMLLEPSNTMAALAGGLALLLAAGGWMARRKFGRLFNPKLRTEDC